MSSDEASDMILSAQKIGKVIEKQFNGTSLTLAMQDGPQAGQTVKQQSPTNNKPIRTIDLY
jgi:bis(5'-adenosyl)-triphosphatase